MSQNSNKDINSSICNMTRSRQQIGQTCWFLSIINALLGSQALFIMSVLWLNSHPELLENNDDDDICPNPKLFLNSSTLDFRFKKVLARIIKEHYVIDGPLVNKIVSENNSTYSKDIAKIVDRGKHSVYEALNVWEKILRLLDIDFVYDNTYATIDISKINNSVYITKIGLFKPHVVQLTIGDSYMLDFIQIGIYPRSAEQGHSVILTRCGQKFQLIDSGYFGGSITPISQNNPKEISYEDVYKVLQDHYKPAKVKFLFIGYVNIKHFDSVKTKFNEILQRDLRKIRAKNMDWNNPNNFDDFMEGAPKQ